MSVSTEIIGFKPADEKWKKMKAIWDSCEKAEIDVPDEVDKFFDGYPPDNAGVEVKLEGTPCCSEYDSEDGEGFEIQIGKLPKAVKVIRFVNSW